MPRFRKWPHETDHASVFQWQNSPRMSLRINEVAHCGSISWFVEAFEDDWNVLAYLLLYLQVSAGLFLEGGYESRTTSRSSRHDAVRNLQRPGPSRRKVWPVQADMDLSRP